MELKKVTHDKIIMWETLILHL